MGNAKLVNVGNLIEHIFMLVFHILLRKVETY